MTNFKLPAATIKTLDDLHFNSRQAYLKGNLPNELIFSTLTTNNKKDLQNISEPWSVIKTAQNAEYLYKMCKEKERLDTSIHTKSNTSILSICRYISLKIGAHFTLIYPNEKTTFELFQHSVQQLPNERKSGVDFTETTRLYKEIRVRESAEAETNDTITQKVNKLAKEAAEKAHNTQINCGFYVLSAGTLGTAALTIKLLAPAALNYLSKRS